MTNIFAHLWVLDIEIRTAALGGGTFALGGVTSALTHAMKFTFTLTP